MPRSTQAKAVGNLPGAMAKSGLGVPAIDTVRSSENRVEEEGAPYLTERVSTVLCDEIDGPEVLEPCGGGYGRFSGAPEFRRWFANSRVVFKQGERDYFQNPRGLCGIPRMVYHGTNADSHFDIFCPDERGAIWFRGDQTVAERLAGKDSAVLPAFLKIENPLELGPTDSITMGAAIEKAKALGNDGVILDSGGGDNIYAVFSPEQIKSPLIGDPFEGCQPGDPGGRGCAPDGPACLAQPSAAYAADATLGKQFQKIERKQVRMVGRTIRNYTDLAVLAQAWRNPNYEEFRYVFVRRGVIVDHERGTCMHPGYSKAYRGDDFGEYIEHLKERIEVLGATYVYMVHNHPNGNPEPSDADIWTSAAVAMSISQYRGHIIINSGKYGYIDDTASNPVVKVLPKLPGDWVDPILQPSVPHELLGRPAESVENIASWAKTLMLNREAPVLVYIDSDGKVRGLQEIHSRNFTNIALMRNRMPQKLIDFGSVGASAVLPEKTTEIMLDAVRYYVRAHILRDAIGFYGDSSYYFSEVESEQLYFGGNLRSSMQNVDVR